MEPATATITRSNIVNNSKYGIQNVTGESINAQHNYWGHESGPSSNVPDPVTVRIANGMGDRVTSDVQFYHWCPQPQLMVRGMYSFFDQHYDTVDLYVRVTGEDYSRVIYDIEIIPEYQIPSWDFVEGIEAPPAWSFEKMDNGVRFFTKTNPLIKCQLTRFRF